MLRVLHVYKNYQPTLGGVETYVRQLAEGLTRRRAARVTVLVVGPGWRTTEARLAGVQVVRAGRVGEIASTPLSPRLIVELARLPADLIHLHLPYPVGELAYLLAGHRRPLVVTYHSDVVRQRWARPLHEPMVRLLLGRAGAIIATSPNYARTSPLLRQFAARTRVIPLAVNPVRFQVSTPRVEDLRRRYPLPVIVFVGRFRRYKGLTTLIRAMVDVPAQLLLIGAGPLESELRSLVRREGLSGRVELLSDVDDRELPVYLAAARALVLPSTQRSEAFGMVLLEAMAAGRPVISTELGTGTSWVNQDGVTGLVVPPSDRDALRAALRTLVDDRELAERLGRAGRARIEATFSEEVMLDRVEALYQEVLRSDR